MKPKQTSHRLPLVAIMLTSVLITSCGGGSASNADSGAGSGANPGTDAGNQSLNAVASDCITMVDEGDTIKNGQVVDGNRNIRVTNHCDYAVNVKLYSAGYVGTTTSRLVPGGSVVDDFFVTPGEPRAFACRAPLVPAIPPGAASQTCI